ncbi:unnamed protein product [Plasmodium vivax]|uniref:(malaria parasite P. vivax) hypothetical protein n=1 Tax=Plasmodium vivax TaxID=5855 RepID=A0A8S4HEX5_PLAVI|nr:unnamed protein product [Plasmodium vivax]
MNKLYLIFFFNIVSLVFLTWISHGDNEVGNQNIYINIKYNKSKTWILRHDRLLTNYDTQSEIEEINIKENLKELEENNKLKDITDSSEIYEKIKKFTSNSMHNYIKNLEHGYPNKKGLKRLDCLYEKKMFNEMYKLDKIAGHRKGKNSYFKKVVWKRYGLRFVILLLFILFGIVTPICCYFGDDASSSVEGYRKYFVSYMLGINGAIYLPLIIAFLYFIIYILSKVGKYKRLKNKYCK